MKKYTIEQAAALNGGTDDEIRKRYEAIRKQLARDSKKPKKDRKYPNARKCECGHGWMIPDKDLKEIKNNE